MSNQSRSATGAPAVVVFVAVGPDLRVETDQ